VLQINFSFLTFPFSQGFTHLFVFGFNSLYFSLQVLSVFFFVFTQRNFLSLSSPSLHAFTHLFVFGFITGFSGRHSFNVYFLLHFGFTFDSALNLVSIIENLQLGEHTLHFSCLKFTSENT